MRRREEKKKRKEEKEQEGRAELGQLRVTLTCSEFCANLWREFSNPKSQFDVLTKIRFCISDSGRTLIPRGRWMVDGFH